MLFVGFVTDGEFNSLRTMGCERPISILQLISDSRSKARSMRVSQIEGFFKLDAHGILTFSLVCVIQPQATMFLSFESIFIGYKVSICSIVNILRGQVWYCLLVNGFHLIKEKMYIAGNPVNQHPAIPVEDVRWLSEFMNDGPAVPFTTALTALKRRLFPLNYEPCEWIEGKEIML